jgi:hypothetical protein
VDRIREAQVIKFGLILLALAVLFAVVPYMFTIRNEAVGFLFWLGCRVLLICAAILIGLGWGLR